MSESAEKNAREEVLKARQEKRIKRAEKGYDIIAADIERIHKRRDEFLKKNDERLAKIRERDNEILEKRRAARDERIKANRARISEKYVGDDVSKRERFEKATQRTDEYIRKRRKKQNEKIDKHRRQITEKREKRDKLAQQMYEEAHLKRKNQLRRVQEDKLGIFTTRQIKVIIGCCVVLLLCIITAQFVIPGSFLKRKEIIDDTPIEEKIDVIPSKEYKKLDGITEDQLLYNLLMEHFDENQIAVLGVMCNLKAESRFQASNLEDYNNTMWDIEDDEYTEKVNRKTIEKKDFLESRVKNTTNGFYNDNSQWVNKDGGYGYGQFTAYDKKDDLYKFAEQWFGPGGPGESYKFNIGDPEMQANYVIHLLESDEYKSLDAQLRTSKEVVDACYLWLKKYEVPYDPYNDNYFTLAFDRAASAEDIKNECAAKYEEMKEAGELGTDGEESTGNKED